MTGPVTTAAMSADPALACCREHERIRAAAAPGKATDQLQLVVGDWPEWITRDRDADAEWNSRIQL